MNRIPSSARTAVESFGGLGPIFSTVSAMLITLAVLYMAARLYMSFEESRKRRSLTAGPASPMMPNPYAPNERAFSFADAVEITTTGSLRKKTLEDKMVACVVPVEMLFSGIDHGLYYQFEMGEWSDQQVKDWWDVTQALGLPEMSKIMEEVVLLRDVMCHPDYDPERSQQDEM